MRSPNQTNTSPIKHILVKYPGLPQCGNATLCQCGIVACKQAAPVAACGLAFAFATMPHCHNVILPHCRNRFPYPKKKKKKKKEKKEKKDKEKATSSSHEGWRSNQGTEQFSPANATSLCNELVRRSCARSQGVVQNCMSGGSARPASPPAAEHMLTRTLF